MDIRDSLQATGPKHEGSLKRYFSMNAPHGSLGRNMGDIRNSLRRLAPSTRGLEKRDFSVCGSTRFTKESGVTNETVQAAIDWPQARGVLVSKQVFNMTNRRLEKPTATCEAVRRLAMETWALVVVSWRMTGV